MISGQQPLGPGLTTSPWPDPTRRPDPTDRPELDAEALVVALARRRVRWVLAGSAVLAGYGARRRPRDLDMVPALDPGNLARLAAVLAHLLAVPLFDPAGAGVPDLAACRAWRPPLGGRTGGQAGAQVGWQVSGQVAESDVDLLFVTVHGLLDVVPHLCGDYADLAAGARWQPLGAAQVPVLVADPARVLAGLPATGKHKGKNGRRRAKDAARATELHRLRAAVTADELRWEPMAIAGGG